MYAPDCCIHPVSCSGAAAVCERGCSRRRHFQIILPNGSGIHNPFCVFRPGSFSSFTALSRRCGNTPPCLRTSARPLPAGRSGYHCRCPSDCSRQYTGHHIKCIRKSFPIHTVILKYHCLYFQYSANRHKNNRSVRYFSLKSSKTVTSRTPATPAAAMVSR